MFIGESNHNLDAKGRYALPTRYRAALNAQDGADTGSCYLTIGPDGCIILVPVSDWQALLQSMRKVSRRYVLPVRPHRKFQRRFFGKARLCTVDPQGRLTVQADLLRLAGIEKELVLVGVGTRLEMWPPDKWEEAQAMGHDEYTQILDDTLDSLDAPAEPMSGEIPDEEAKT